jgi:hypothetical protein
MNEWGQRLTLFIGKRGAGCKPTNVKGLKSRLLTDLIRLPGRSPPGIGYTIERAELTTKDNKYKLIDSFMKY